MFNGPYIKDRNAFNPFTPNVFFYHNSLDWSISNRKDVQPISIITMFYRNSCIKRKQCRPLSDAASYLGLHCLPMSLLWDVRHKWVTTAIEMSHYVRKRTFWLVRLKKTQTSLHIRSTDVCTLAIQNAPSEYSAYTKVCEVYIHSQYPVESAHPPIT